MKNIHYKPGRTRRFFEGWYVKHECAEETVAFIPGIHFDAGGNASAFMQVVLRDRAVYAEFPATALYADKRRFYVKLGDCEFTDRYARIAFNREGLSISGEIRYGALTKLPYGIMGPFFFGMQCSHGILSLSHSLQGSLLINGRRVDFSDGRGYIEKDFGHSFPESYTWVQAFDPQSDASVVAAVATIPVLNTTFTGVIAVAAVDGVQYRFATYNGARIVEAGQKRIELKRGKKRLILSLPAADGQYLRAPVAGSMSRRIKEHAAARVTAALYDRDRPLCTFTTPHACFECVEQSDN